jgi:hypothetical protein
MPFPRIVESSIVQNENCCIHMVIYGMIIINQTVDLLVRNTKEIELYLPQGLSRDEPNSLEYTTGGLFHNRRYRRIYLPC